MSLEPFQQNDSQDTQQLKYFPFQLRTYELALLISVILCLILPVLALILCIIISLLSVIIYIVSPFVAIAAFIGILIQSFSDDPPETISDFLGLLIVDAVASSFAYAVLTAIALEMQELAEGIPTSLFQFFLDYRIYIWAWIPVVIIMLPTVFKICCIITCFIYKSISTVLIVLATGTYRTIRAILLWMMIIIDRLFSGRNYRYICPTEGCDFIGKTTDYQCPYCGTIITNLNPSNNGFFYTHCPKCNNSVSTFCLTGRNKYTKVCPRCHNTHGYSDFGKKPTKVFVVEGASKCGKTSFLMKILAQWSLHFSDQVSFSIERQNSEVLSSIIKINNQSFCPPTTKLLHPEAYVMQFKKSSHSFLTYFYDTGGILSDNLDAGSSEPYYNLANGIFLVIDPWAEEGILQSFGKKADMRNYSFQFASQDANAVIGRLCSKLEHIYTKTGNARFNIPICVIVTKCDVNGLNNVIGIDERFTQSSKKWAEQSKQVEEFLIKHGMYNFVNAVKTRFKKNAFFAVSVIENSESVLNPLLWMTCNVK